MNKTYEIKKEALEGLEVLAEGYKAVGYDITEGGGENNGKEV